MAATAARLNPGATTVGTRIELDHQAATAVGRRITVLATLSKIDGRRLVFDIVVRDGDGAGRGGSGGTGDRRSAAFRGQGVRRGVSASAGSATATPVRPGRVHRDRQRRVRRAYPSARRQRDARAGRRRPRWWSTRCPPGCRPRRCWPRSGGSPHCHWPCSTRTSTSTTASATRSSRPAGGRSGRTRYSPANCAERGTHWQRRWYARLGHPPSRYSPPDWPRSTIQPPTDLVPRDRGPRPRRPYRHGGLPRPRAHRR